jgi:hypothetical protein
VTYRCIKNTSQNYVYETYAASIIQYPLQNQTYKINILCSFKVSKLRICARSIDVVHIILRIKTVCFPKHCMVSIISSVRKLNKDVNAARFKPVVINVIKDKMEQPLRRFIYQKYSEG